ncbi:hypothetical protein DSO57_1026484 [Entomophthora muscae]|uniref:Uncharacterized protein n=1 Tax=Entomophthora muscae TaxID=34485 RepID=A0ACC2UB44_9FUNG|nr:hypothetical protein DSO57_1026484 [Entomophthora muscae]
MAQAATNGLTSTAPAIIAHNAVNNAHHPEIQIAVELGLSGDEVWDTFASNPGPEEIPLNLIQ